MQYPSFFLARRLVRHSFQRGILGSLLRLAAVSIVIASGAFLLVGAIMNGFHAATIRALQGVRAPCTLQAPKGRMLDYQAVRALVEAQYPGRVRCFLPRSEVPVLMIDDRQELDITDPLLCIAIDPEAEQCVEGLTRMIVPEGSLMVLAEYAIIIGAERALSEGISVGDTLSLAYPHEQDSTQMNRIRCRVVGIVTTGIQELDERIVLMHYRDATLFTGTDWPRELGFIPAHPDENAVLCSDLAVLCAPLRVVSWESLNPTLASALALEHAAMGAILFLICILAALSISALMVVFVREQRPIIALMRAYGIPASTIVRALVGVGFSLVVASGCVGMILGSVVAYSMDRYQLISLPSLYYISHVPALVTVPLVYGVIAVVCVVGFLATYIPVRRAYYVEPASILREEV
jgi:lipoprotein-releasing system permease protein